jgi:hypothetical protein
MRSVGYLVVCIRVVAGPTKRKSGPGPADTAARAHLGPAHTGARAHWARGRLGPSADTRPAHAPARWGLATPVKAVPGTTERDASLAQRDEGIVADHEVVEQLDVE